MVGLWWVWGRQRTSRARHDVSTVRAVQVEVKKHDKSGDGHRLKGGPRDTASDGGSADSGGRPPSVPPTPDLGPVATVAMPGPLGVSDEEHKLELAWAHGHRVLRAGAAADAPYAAGAAANGPYDAGKVDASSVAVRILASQAAEMGFPKELALQAARKLVGERGGVGHPEEVLDQLLDVLHSMRLPAHAGDVQSGAGGTAAAHASQWPADGRTQHFAAPAPQRPPHRAVPFPAGPAHPDAASDYSTADALAAIGFFPAALQAGADFAAYPRTGDAVMGPAMAAQLAPSVAETELASRLQAAEARRAQLEAALQRMQHEMSMLQGVAAELHREHSALQGELSALQRRAGEERLRAIEAATMARQVKKQRDELHERSTCRVCEERTVEVALIPCGHACLCEACADATQSHHGSTCPLCRVPYTQKLRIFLA